MYNTIFRQLMILTNVQSQMFLLRLRLSQEHRDQKQNYQERVV